MEPEPETTTDLARSRTDLAAQAPPPSVESLLMVALERGIDAATLERLVALQERVTAQRAEQALNEAMLAFRRACPPILRKSEARDPNKGDRLLYKFADLSEVTKVVDPHLFANGLSYTWDSDAEGTHTTVTCTVHHVAGAKRTAKFRAPGRGTSIMSPAQVEASLLTFGKRQSLLAALGVTTDIDDDGRRAPALPSPAHDPAAPRVGTRAEREADENFTSDEMPRVTAEDLNQLAVTWRAKLKPADNGRRAFVAWCVQTLRTETDLNKVANWTVDALDACKEALK
jgi:hypothetical protein